MLINSFDSLSLDNELNNQLWSTYHRNILPQRNLQATKFILKALIFFASTKSDRSFSSTYGSSLTGVVFTTTKSIMFTTNVLLPFILDQLQSRPYIYNIKSFRLLTNLAQALSFTTFLQFLSGNSKVYITLIHKLFRITAMSTNNSASYRSSVNSSIEFQNSQLLYNAVLQLLGTQVVKSEFLHKLIRRKYSTSHHLSNSSHCPTCNNLPTNPYLSNCCSKHFCYLCVLKCIERQNCSFCDSKINAAGPLYSYSFIKG
ncbi:LANO_0G03070g1_1 [Lachancea nothofagi CBS 11611]|uniref:LANO_0G03070g1_1 n=1 Tax=Lachancea nothofagi CBS 11611 TaxID=1266666 RepID=A0A1G4KFH6_9SACH|nr:LANO_0G03070g1_1 [Lachancea nothofagi CBS 11611]